MSEPKKLTLGERRTWNREEYKSSENNSKGNEQNGENWYQQNHPSHGVRKENTKAI